MKIIDFLFLNYTIPFTCHEPRLS